MKTEGRFRYFLFHKPFGVLCQFSRSEGKVTLSGFGPFPPDVYPAGRLDAESEGLVLLTNDGPLQHLLLNPRYGHPRTYLVQVERQPSPEAIRRLRSGVVIEGRRTLPAEVRLIDEPALAPRSVPVRFRKSVPTAWIEITLREGKNRQVRKMTAAVGHPTLRLVRSSIGPLTLAGLAGGESRELNADEVESLRRLLLHGRRVPRIHTAGRSHRAKNAGPP